MLLPFTETGRGQPIMLVHSFPADRRIWSSVAAILSEKFRVICPDLHGFGANAPASKLSINDMAKDIADLAVTLHAAPCAMAGLSMGGYVIQAVARDYPATINRLILVDTKAAADNPQQRDARDAIAALAVEHGSLAVFEKMRPNLLSPDAKPAAVGFAKMIAEAQSPLTIAAASRAMRDRDDYSELLPKLKIPIDLIFGEFDAGMPPDAVKALHDSVPSASRTQISNAGHLSPLENPAEVAAAIASALQSKPL